MRKPVSVILALLIGSLLWGDPADDLLNSINRAVSEEFYGKAIQMIDQGKSLFPSDTRFAIKEGDLYSERKLYNLALEAYKEAEEIDPADREIRKEIAEILGFLDRNEEALFYLEELVEEEYDTFLVDDLGWMYFKTHQAEKGIPLLEEAIHREFRKSLALTLGTLYSEVNNQELCRKYYLDSINSALKSRDHYFASVAYYNLSIAEHSFYSYEKAIEYARLSLEEMDRSGGHLALGDLYLTKGDYDAAEEHIRNALGLDETPLSSMSLASFYRQTGRLEAALFEIKALEGSQDDSWMYYYGIDRSQFNADLFELKRDIYKGLYHQERLTARQGFTEGIKKTGRLIKHYILYRYFDSQFRVQSYRIGRLQWQRNSRLRGALTLAASAEGFSASAYKYWTQARVLEQGEPLSEAWYDFESGRALGDRELLMRALQLFQKDWESSMVEESYRALLLNHLAEEIPPGKAAEEIYNRNPGGLKQYGLKLPVLIEFSGFESRRDINRIRRNLKKQGLIPVKDFSGFEPVLRLHRNPAGEVEYHMNHPDGKEILSGKTTLPDNRRKALFHISEVIEEGLFPR